MSAPRQYAASCNPPRRAKKSAPSLAPAGSSYTMSSRSPSSESESPLPVPRRGRKPGPMSRSAKDVQRKLNHSIIEKARRTKINDALSTLRELIPLDFDKEVPVNDDDDEYEEGNKDKDKGKTKEFKLEILERTVIYMRHLIERVQSLENAAQVSVTIKRKRFVDSDDDEQPRKIAKSTASASHTLPSLSTWLSSIDSLFPERSEAVQQLPSPPSSTHVIPTQPSQLPPALTLGPMAIPLPSPSARTPEDESAASLLLQIGQSTRSFASADIFAQTPSSILGMSTSSKAGY